jgi:hypothetical protein
MSQWGNNDVANNSVLWGVTQYNETPNTDNRDAFFGNTTADAYVTGITVGQYGESVDEAAAKRAAAAARPAHAGWVIKTEGSGGRAGRVSYETLVAMGSIGGDSEDVTFPDYTILITTQPLANTANTTAGATATFRVVAESVPAGATLGYAWTYANGSSLGAGANVGVTTAANLVVNSAVVTQNTSFKVTVTATGAANVVSSNAVLTITT